MPEINEHRMHAKTNGGHMSPELESLHESLNELKEDVGRLFEHAKGTARTGVGAVRHMASDAVGGLKDRGEESVEHLTRRIEKNPLTSVAIAFGIGYVFSKLMRR